MCRCKCHEGVWGSEGIVNSHMSGKWICQHHALVALPPGKFSWYPLNRRLGVDTGEWRNFLPLSVIDLQSRGCQIVLLFAKFLIHDIPKRL